MDNLCICCGESVPEGRQVCKECETKAESKPKRNIDRLREMSAKELGALIGDVRCNICVYKGLDCMDIPCYEGVTAWLEKEVEDNGA
jgi:predicted nucleic acid-binding Zn ribbon protein